MNYSEANEIADVFRKIGGFSRVTVSHRGFLATLTEEAKTDGKWTVELWVINPSTGNRSVELVDSCTVADCPRIARKAKGKATAADMRAMARMGAESAANKT